MSDYIIYRVRGRVAKSGRDSEGRRINVVEENGSAEKWNKGTKNEALNYLQDCGYEIVAQCKNDYILEKK